MNRHCAPVGLALSVPALAMLTAMPDVLSDDSIAAVRQISQLLFVWSSLTCACFWLDVLAVHGTSMQAKLEALANVGKVQVTRSGPMALNAYDWTITFMTEPGSMLASCAQTHL